MKNLIITILSILVLGLGGYLVYDKALDKDVKEEVKEESSKQESKNFDLAEAKKLVDKYTLDFLFWENMFQGTMSEDDKIYLAIKYTESTNIDYTCSEAFPGSKFENGSYVFTQDNSKGTCYDNNEYGEEYTYDSLNKVYKELFGNNKEIPKKMISGVVCSKYAYSEKYDAYINVSGGCGGAYYQSSYYDVFSANETSDTLEIIINYVEFRFNEYDKKYYVSQNTNINVSVDDPHDVTDEQIKNLYDRAIKELDEDEIPKYKFTFKKSDTGYYLDSIIKEVY